MLLTLLNQPPADWIRIKAWCEDAYLQSSPEPGDLERFRVADAGPWAYSGEVVADRQRNPRDPDRDLVSALISLRIDGQPMPVEHVTGVVRLFIAAGHDSTTSAVGICIHYLARSLEDQARLRAEPARPLPQSRRCCAWRHRFEQCHVVSLHDVEVHGRYLKQGDRIMLNWQSGNRDPAAFEEPDKAAPGPQAQHSPGLWSRHPQVHRRAPGASGDPGSTGGTARGAPGRSAWLAL